MAWTWRETGLGNPPPGILTQSTWREGEKFVGAWHLLRDLWILSNFIWILLNFLWFCLHHWMAFNECNLSTWQSKHQTSLLYDFIYFLFDFLWNITWHPGYIFKVFKLFQSRAFSGGILWKLTRRYPNHPLCRTVDHRHLLVCIEISLKEFLSKKCP